MISALLATNAIVFGAVGAFAALSFVYGIFKKSSRMSWTGLQVLLVFALTFVLGVVKGSGLALFLLAVGIVFVAAAGLYGLEAFLKGRMRDSTSKGVVAFDRIWGALISVLNLLVFVAAAGGFILCVIDACMGLQLPLFQSSLWTNFCAKHVADLLLVLFLVGAFRGGYKLGLLKLVWLIVGLFATGAAFFGSFYLVTTVGFLKSFAGTVAGALQALGGGVAAALGRLIVTLICFIVIAAVLVVLFWLFNMLVKKLNRSRAFTAIDSSVLAVILFVLAVLFVCCAHLGMSYLSQAVGGILGGAFEAYVGGLGEVFSSAPLSKIFYEFNPLMRLFGK